MLVAAATFSDFVLALHIMAVVVGFGVTFAYPIFFRAAERIDRKMVPGLHQLQLAVSRRLINPGLLVILIAGIYLASHEHQWKNFYVQWGLAMVVILGGLEGGYIVPRIRQMAEVGARDLAGASAGEWSADYIKLRNRVAPVSALMSLLVLITIVIMAAHVGA
jgi:hypothetical protein